VCSDPVSETVSLLSEQFPTPSQVALLQDIVQFVCRSKLEP
jgi:hypothetical protein